MRRLRFFLECLPSDEVVVELDERPVAQRVRREVVILDVPGHEAAADGGRAFVAVRRQPFAVLLHPLAGVHRGQRRGNPAGLEGVAGVGARAYLHETEVLARLHYGLADFIRLGVRTPDLQARSPGHAVPQAAHLAPLDVDRIHLEELHVRQRPAVEFLQHLGGVRPLDLVAVMAPGDRVAAWV